MDQKVKDTIVAGIVAFLLISMFILVNRRETTKEDYEGAPYTSKTALV